MIGVNCRCVSWISADASILLIIIIICYWTLILLVVASHTTSNVVLLIFDNLIDFMLLIYLVTPIWVLQAFISCAKAIIENHGSINILILISGLINFYLLISSTKKATSNCFHTKFLSSILLWAAFNLLMNHSWPLSLINTITSILITYVLLFLRYSRAILSLFFV